MRTVAPVTEAVARMCTDKSRMADEPAARAMAMHMLASGWIRRSKAWVYRCDHCRGWHVTTHGGGSNFRTAAVTAGNAWVPPVELS